MIDYLDELPYPLEYNHGVVFFNMSFWVRFNSKNPSKRGLFDQKMGFYSRKSPKTGLLKRGEVIFKSGAVLEWIRYTITDWFPILLLIWIHLCWWKIGSIINEWNDNRETVGGIMTLQDSFFFFNFRAQCLVTPPPTILHPLFNRL